MRTDYILYVVAVICFIIAASYGSINNFTPISNNIIVVVLVIIGVIFAVGGYSLRPSPPKVARVEPAMPPTKPAMEEEQPTAAPSPPQPETKPEPMLAPPSEPTPTPMPEPETAEETPQPETPPPETKPVRKRRERKKTA
jgi:outer membrane biosynthesis protein TonB